MLFDRAVGNRHDDLVGGAFLGFQDVLAHRRVEVDAIHELRRVALAYVAVADAGGAA